MFPSFRISSYPKTSFMRTLALYYPLRVFFKNSVTFLAQFKSDPKSNSPPSLHDDHSLHIKRTSGALSMFFSVPLN